MRRVYSIILILVTVIGIVCSLSSCAKSGLENVMTKGDYLSLICESFGMTTYESETPYTKTVGADSKYFPAVQTAWEWDVFSDEEIEPNDLVSKGFLAETLVRCVGIETVTDLSKKEIGKLAYEKGYVTFNYGGFSSKRNASVDEINECIKKSVDIWTNRNFESVEEIKVSEDVVNVASTGIKPDEIIYDEENDVIAIPQEYVNNLKAGEVFAVPTENSVPIDTYTYITDEKNSSDEGSEEINDDLKSDILSVGAVYTAEKVEYVDGYAIIHKSDEVDEDVIIEDLEYSGSHYPDLTTLPIVDGAGNVINPQASNVSSFNKPTIETLAYSSDSNPTTQDCVEGSFKFKKDNVEFSVTISEKDISVSIKGPLETKKGIPAKVDLSNNKSAAVEVSQTFTISDIGVDFDWDIKWGKLKYAYSELSYTVASTTSLKATYNNGSKLFIDQRKTPSLNNILNSKFRDEACSKASKTFTIVSFPLVNGGLGRIDVDVKAVLTVSGSVELVVSTRNSNGIEIKNGKIRYLQKKDNDVDVNVKATVEATIYLGVAIKILKNTELLSAGFEGGVGVQWTCTAHLYNSSNQKVEEISFEGNGEYLEASYNETGQKEYTLKFCGDVVTYGILKFTFSQDCYLYDALKKAAKSGKEFGLEFEFLGKSNATIDSLCAHYENWQKVSECTRKLGADEPETETTSVDKNLTRADALIGDKLDINSYSFNLKVGQKEQIVVTQIPGKAAASKISFSSSDTGVVTVDAQGNIKAVGEGIASVSVKIDNTDFEMSCMVYVEE